MSRRDKVVGTTIRATRVTTGNRRLTFLSYMTSCNIICTCFKSQVCWRMIVLGVMMLKMFMLRGTR